jgi:ribonuclease P protein component|tara:strand:- start:851 stop:1192 length:342 start_codon:yes stop_codon:yes gene_type:complete
MNIRLLSISKNQDFKLILTGKKVSNKYLNIFFKKLSDKSSKNLNISFLAQKKLGNAVKRNKIKRRLRNIMRHISKISKINLKYSYLIIAKQTIINAKFIDVKEVLAKDYRKIK